MPDESQRKEVNMKEFVSLKSRRKATSTKPIQPLSGGIGTTPYTRSATVGVDISRITQVSLRWSGTNADKRATA